MLSRGLRNGGRPWHRHVDEVTLRERLGVADSLHLAHIASTLETLRLRLWQQKFLWLHEDARREREREEAKRLQALAMHGGGRGGRSAGSGQRPRA